MKKDTCILTNNSGVELGVSPWANEDQKPAMLRYA